MLLNLAGGCAVGAFLRLGVIRLEWAMVDKSSDMVSRARLSYLPFNEGMVSGGPAFVLFGVEQGGIARAAWCGITRGKWPSKVPLPFIKCNCHLSLLSLPVLRRYGHVHQAIRDYTWPQ